MPAFGQIGDGGTNLAIVAAAVEVDGNLDGAAPGDVEVSGAGGDEKFGGLFANAEAVAEFGAAAPGEVLDCEGDLGGIGGNGEVDDRVALDPANEAGVEEIDNGRLIANGSQFLFGFGVVKGDEGVET